MRGVVLAIDPATVSGWAVFVDGAYDSSGEGRLTRAERDSVAKYASDAATARPLAVVMETWQLHGKWSNVAKQSVCESAGKWKDSLGQYMGEHRIVRVQVDVWRREVIGGGRRTSQAWKKLAMVRASAVAGKRSLGHNEAEAVCMGFWGLHARDVHVLLGGGRDV